MVDMTFNEVIESRFKPNRVIVQNSGMTSDQEIMVRFAKNGAGDATRLLQVLG